MPPPPPLATDEASPHGFALVLQMAQGTTLVLPFTERLPNDQAIDAAAPDGSEPAAWPRFGEFRWRLPESAAHETEVRHAAVWRQADDAYCLFRELSGDGQRRGAESSDGRAGRRTHDRRRFSDATWPHA